MTAFRPGAISGGVHLDEMGTPNSDSAPAPGTGDSKSGAPARYVRLPPSRPACRIKPPLGPADALISMSGWKKIGLGAALIAGLWLVGTGWKELRASRQLAATGKPVAALVLGKDSHRARLGRVSRWVEVKFQTEAGQTLRPRLHVGAEEYEKAIVGARVPLHYLPKDPANCQVGDEIETRFGALLGGIASIFVGALGVLLPTGQRPQPGASLASASTIPFPQSAGTAVAADQREAA